MKGYITVLGKQSPLFVTLLQEAEVQNGIILCFILTTYWQFYAMSLVATTCHIFVPNQLL